MPRLPTLLAIALQRTVPQIIALTALLCAAQTASGQEFHRVSMGVKGSVVTDGDLPQISDDGLHVSYISTSDNIVDDSVNGGERVFVLNRASGISTQASISEDNQYIPAGVWHSMSVDGRFVAFSSGNILVRDRLTGATTLASVGLDGFRGQQCKQRTQDQCEWTSRRLLVISEQPRAGRR